MDIDQKFMKLALREANKAKEEDEVPIGAVAVLDGKVIARGHNTREKTGNAINHAEMIVIQKACKKVGNWRLDQVTIYVTIEPCPMCMGAIINSRMGKVIYGAKDAKAGACGSVLNMNSYPLNHKPVVKGGFMKDECAQILTDFFKNKRSK